MKGCSNMSAPGWYPDPAGTPQRRYFDGTAWTDHYAPPPVPGGPLLADKPGSRWTLVWVALAVVALSLAVHFLL